MEIFFSYTLYKKMEGNSILPWIGRPDKSVELVNPCSLLNDFHQTGRGSTKLTVNELSFKKIKMYSPDIYSKECQDFQKIAKKQHMAWLK